MNQQYLKIPNPLIFFLQIRYFLKIASAVALGYGSSKARVVPQVPSPPCLAPGLLRVWRVCVRVRVVVVVVVVAGVVVVVVVFVVVVVVVGSTLSRPVPSLPADVVFRVRSRRRRRRRRTPAAAAQRRRSLRCSLLCCSLLCCSR